MMEALFVIFLLGMATVFYSENKDKIDDVADTFNETFKD